MTYTKLGDFYLVSRVTGPTHNLLGLGFSSFPAEDVILEDLDTSPVQGIDESSLKRTVLAAVVEANAALGTTFHVDRIQYVSSDSPWVDVYALLARTIIERLARGVDYAETCT